MDTIEIVGGDFGRGNSRYEAATFYFPNDSWRSIGIADRVATNGSFLQRDWLAAIRNGAALGTPAILLGIMAAPAAAIALPFGLTIGAIAAGLAVFSSGTSDAVLIEVVFVDGKHFVGMCRTELPDVISRDLEVARKLGATYQQRANPAISTASGMTPTIAATISSAAGSAVDAASTVAARATDMAGSTMSAIGTAAGTAVDLAGAAATSTGAAATTIATNVSETANSALGALRGWIRRE